MRMPVAIFTASVLILAIGGIARSQASKPVDNARLTGADRDSGKWLMYGRTYDDHRFSSLKQINEQTIAKLGLIWSRELGTTRGLEATPLVENGVIYTTGSWSIVYALDAKTGDVRWTYDPAVPRTRAFFICCDVVNRGVALYRGKVYVGTLDGRLIFCTLEPEMQLLGIATFAVTLKATTSMRPRSSPCTRAMARWRGTSRRYLATIGTTTQHSRCYRRIS